MSEPRKKGIYIGAPACFALEQACAQVAEAFGAFRDDEHGEHVGGIYVVGSCLDRADWRDVDVRFIVADKVFARWFPGAGDIAHARWEFDPRWLLLTVALSDWLKKQTGLPVDFQFQPQSHANERHKGPRNAVGMRIARGA